MTSSKKGASFDVILIGTPAALGALEPLVGVAGGHVVKRRGWDYVPKLDCPYTDTVYVIDLRDAGTEIGVMLGHIERKVETQNCRVVALLDVTKIDECTGLTGHGAQLLCDPEDAEIVAALAIAGGVGHALHDMLGESEAARLRRLNEEVARIADVISRLAKQEDSTSSSDAADTERAPSIPAITIEASEIRRTIRARRLRDQQFGTGLFEDPAWEMMLDLFAAELDRTQVSVSSLCVAASVAPTTALRWVTRLVDAGLFRREPDPFDRRRAFIALSERASAGMRNYIAAVRAAGLPIA